jgi:DNA-binding MarR family transcriptional regulator
MAAAGPAPATTPVIAGQPAIDRLESALHALVQSLKQVRLHEYLLAQARVDVDRAGLALLYALHTHGASLRLTDLAETLHIDGPAVTRKAQQLERAGLISRLPDDLDGRASRLQLTNQGRQVVRRLLAARRTWLAELLERWPDDQKDELAGLLTLFAGQVENHLERLDG